MSKFMLILSFVMFSMNASATLPFGLSKVTYKTIRNTLLAGRTAHAFSLFTHHNRHLDLNDFEELIAYIKKTARKHRADTDDTVAAPSRDAEPAQPTCPASPVEEEPSIFQGFVSDPNAPAPIVMPSLVEQRRLQEEAEADAAVQQHLEDTLQPHPPSLTDFFWALLGK